MSPPLPLTETDVETLTGLEVNGLYVGDLLSGCYRRSIGHPQRRLSQVLSQVIALVILFVLCLPIGFAGLAGQSPQGQDLLRFVQGPAIVSGLLFGAWHLSLRRQSLRLGRLLLLLEEVDQYNAVVAAIDLATQLQGLAPQADRPSNLHQGIDLTRQTLVVALQTDRLLRQSNLPRAQRASILQPGLTQIEDHLLQLRSIEVQQQGQETARLIGDAVAIGLRVRSELDPRL
jgi:hypothetical protein